MGENWSLDMKFSRHKPVYHDDWLILSWFTVCYIENERLYNIKYRVHVLWKPTSLAA